MPDAMDAEAIDSGVIEDVVSGPTTAVFQVPRPMVVPNNFNLPWPNDLSVDAMGFVDLHFFPGIMTADLTRSYADLMQGKLRGFSPMTAAYFRFSAAIDVRSLPNNGDATILASASAFIIDIDALSPSVGRRTPAVFQFRERGNRFFPTNTLAIGPAPGYPLRTRTRYAVVLTDAIRGADGTPIRPDADWRAITDLANADPTLATAAVPYRSALARLRAVEVDTSHVVAIATFVTSDPTDEFMRAAAVTRQPSTRTPELINIVRLQQAATYTTYGGTYGPNPVFQRGQSPYNAEGSGDFVLDAMGNPVVQTYDDAIRFVVSVPNGVAPPGGWPIAVYAHGTGGDANSFVSDGTASALASERVACFGFDQIFNGLRTRPGGSAETQFFNFVNPFAARSNNRQAAIDLVQVARLLPRFVIPAAISGAGDVTFAGADPMFFGHSQGGLNGPLWLATPGGPAAAVLSGAGATLALSLVLKTEPINIPMVVAALIGVPPSDLSPLHPVITLAQTIADPADPVHYARSIITEPRAGGAPRNVFLTQGFLDRYAPPASIASLAVAMGLPLLDPVLHADTTSVLSTYPHVALPQRANLAMGAVTGGWQQFDAPAGRDGHFVVFDVPQARTRAAHFLGTYASNRPMAPVLE
jgi:hypothetical protein